MKELLCAVCLLLVVGGCTKMYFHRPNTTLEQCSQDFFECDPGHTFNPTGLFYPWCMKDRGYQNLTKDQLPMEVRTRQTRPFHLQYLAGS